MIRTSCTRAHSPRIGRVPPRGELRFTSRNSHCAGTGRSQRFPLFDFGINRGCPIFKFHLPYSEADHVLNIAFNLLAIPRWESIPSMYPIMSMRK